MVSNTANSRPCEAAADARAISAAEAGGCWATATGNGLSEAVRGSHDGTRSERVKKVASPLADGWVHTKKHSG